MDTIMELNKETASRLWVQQFGKKQKAVDFAGREIARAAYNDRNSDYGWNVDHILPESRGGKTADHNLICCSIKTNDEKADRFPSFKANGKLFEIHRKQNHYEIIEKSQNDNEGSAEQDDTVNFFDPAQGTKCWKKCKPSKNPNAFVTYVKIKIAYLDNDSNITEKFKCFIQELFGIDNIFEESDNYPWHSQNRSTIFTIVNFDAPSKDDSEELLENCIILNSYREYLISSTDISEMYILCGMNCYDNRKEMTSSIFRDIFDYHRLSFTEYLAINELIKINTQAAKVMKSEGEEVIPAYPTKWYRYNRIYTKLSKDLEKRIKN